MDEITKEVSKENRSQVPVVNKQEGTKVELAQPNALLISGIRVTKKAVGKTRR